MAYLNKVYLMGNLGKDPEIRVFPSGGKCATFSLATTKRYRDNNGEKKEQTQWHTVKVLGKSAVDLVAVAVVYGKVDAHVPHGGEAAQGYGLFYEGHLHALPCGSGCRGYSCEPPSDYHYVGLFYYRYLPFRDLNSAHSDPPCTFCAISLSAY